jgi:tRNA (guanine37-N1)-methyltransferase
LKIDIVTLFPRMFEGPLDESILKRARQKGLVEIAVHQLREHAEGKHRITDDRPFGGGPGMVMLAGPIVRCVESLKKEGSRVILLSPRGQPLRQEILVRLAKLPHLVLVCGHYEGVDERARELVVDEEISIGDYVLTNGALPAMVLADGVARLVPGVLGDAESASEESFSEGLLEYPQYTRPAEFRGLKVPDILLSGDHGEIARWRREQSLHLTRERRPDLGMK